MLKHIFLHMDRFSRPNSIRKFCETHKKYLDQHGFWRPTYEEIFHSSPPQIPWLKNMCEYYYLTPRWQATYNIPSSAYALRIIKKKIISNPHIHSLLLGIEDSFIEDILSIITLFKQLFPEIELHILWHPAFANLQVEWDTNACIMYGWNSAHFLQRTKTNLGMQNAPDWWKQLDSKVRAVWGNNLSVDVIIADTEDILPQWQKWTNLPQPYPVIESTNFKCTPKVLAFILTLQPLLEWQKVGTKEFAQGKQPYNWQEQEKIFGFENDISPNYQYLRDYWINMLKQDYVKKNYAPWPLLNTENQTKLSEIPISINAKDAQVLVSLLTPDFRKLLLQDIDPTNLQYKAQDVRNVHGALLLAEKIIKEDEFNKLTAYPKGTCLPISQESIIEVCNAPPVVAVLTMCYNQKDFIEENILSVMAQETKFPVTHIISDDASTDGTQEILKEYSAKYPHIHLILNEHNSKGVQSILNVFSQAKTPYVALCDGDDYYSDPLKLQSQVDLLEANPSYGLCFHPVKILYEDYPEVEHIYPPKHYFPKPERPYYHLIDGIRGNLIQTNSVMYRWRFRDGLPAWFNPNLCPGDWYWHLLHAECGKIGFQNKVMSVYRRHKGGVFYKTVFSTVEHRKKFGFREVDFFKHINLHFEGRYEKVIIVHIMNVFMDILTDAEMTGDDSAFKAFIKRYPEHVNDLRLHLAKLKGASTSR